MPPGPIIRCSDAANRMAIAASVRIDNANGPTANGAAIAAINAIAPAILSVRGAGRTSGSGPAGARVTTASRPSNPFGLTASTTAITTKISTSVARGRRTDAERLAYADQNRGGERAENAAEATDDDDHERIRQDGDIDAGVCRAIGQHEAATEAGQPGAERENRGE